MKSWWPLCVLMAIAVLIAEPVEAGGLRFEDNRQIATMPAEARSLMSDGRAANSGDGSTARPASSQEASGIGLVRPVASAGTGGLLFLIVILITAGPAVLVVFFLLTGRPLPEWARASTFSHALKTILKSETKGTVPTIRNDFDATRFIREAKAAFLQVQARGDAESASDWQALLAPTLLAELEAQGRASQVNAVANLQAEFLGVETDDQRQVASVRFSGFIADGTASVPISQVWEFSRSSPAGRWVVTEIENIDAVSATLVTESAGQHEYRLTPRETRQRQIWTSLAIGLLFGTLGATLLKDAVGHEVQGFGDLMDENLWLEFLIGGVFCLIGLLALWRATVTFISLGRQATIVEVMPLRFARGSKVRITFRQPGPLSLKSLRANLVGNETWSQVRDKGYLALGSHELLNSGTQEIVPDHPFETTVTLLVPRNLKPSGPTANGHDVEWVIEVWGKVSRGVDFAHSYLVQIC